MILDKKSKTFVIYIAALKAQLIELLNYLNKKTQLVFLLTEKVIILDTHSKFVDVLLEKKDLMLPEQTKVNKHTIKLKNDK